MHQVKITEVTGGGVGFELTKQLEALPNVGDGIRIGDHVYDVSYRIFDIVDGFTHLFVSKSETDPLSQFQLL